MRGGVRENCADCAAEWRAELRAELRGRHLHELLVD